MDYGIFGQLGTEEIDTESTPSYSIMEEIAHEEAYGDVLAIEAEINKDVAAMAQADAAADRLEQQIGVESKLITTPENVTSSVVNLAVESLATTATVLGLAPESVIGEQLGTESIEANPVTALKLGTESKVSFLRKIINSIKSIFKKVINAAKKLYAKLVVLMDGTGKKAEKLIKHINKNMSKATADKKVLEEKDGKKYYNLVGIFNDYDGKNANDNVPGITNAVNTVIGLYRAYAALGDDASEEDITKAKNDLNGKINPIISNIKSITITPDALENNFGFDKPDAKDGKFTVAVTSFSGTKARVVASYVTDDEKVDTKLIAKTLTYDISDKDFDKVNINTIENIKSSLEEIKSAGKGTKKYKDQVMKAIEDADKALDKLAKSEAGDSKIGYLVNKLKAGAATATRDLTVSILLNILLDYVKNNKYRLSAAKLHLSYYSTGGSEM